MIYHKLLVLLLETLDEGASTLISWARYLTNKQTKRMVNYSLGFSCPHII